MRLRPRYSLLTLLVLTALVAGGVKLWRGPHWRTLSDPPTDLDKALLAKHSPRSEFQKLLASEVKCKYLHTWTGPELLLIHGQTRAEAPLTIGKAIWHESGASPPETSFWYFERAIYPGTRSEGVESRPRETIRAWYSPSFQPSPSFQRWKPREESSKPIEKTNPNGYAKPVEYTVLRPRMPLCYFVSDRKFVYQSQDDTSYLLIAKIQVSDIPDPEVRALIEQELAQIPE